MVIKRSLLIKAEFSTENSRDPKLHVPRFNRV